MSDPRFRGPDPFAPGAYQSVPPGAPAYPPAPGYPGAPANPAGAVRPSAPPATVWLALACLAVAGALCVVQAVMGVRAASKSGVDDAQREYLGREVADLSTTAIVFTVLLAAVFALAYAGFGYAVWRGQGWPAPVGTVLTALSLFGLMGGPVIIALVIAGVLAVVLLWLPPSRAYAHGRPTTAAAPTAYDPWGGR